MPELESELIMELWNVFPAPSTQHPAPHPIGSKSLVHRSDFPPEPTGLIFAHEDAQTSNGHISHFLSSLLIADDGLVYSTFQPVVANSMAIVFYKPCR